MRSRSDPACLCTEKNVRTTHAARYNYSVQKADLLCSLAAFQLEYVDVLEHILEDQNCSRH